MNWTGKSFLMSFLYSLNHFAIVSSVWRTHSIREASKCGFSPTEFSAISSAADTRQSPRGSARHVVGVVWMAGTRASRKLRKDRDSCFLNPVHADHL